MPTKLIEQLPVVSGVNPTTESIDSVFAALRTGHDGLTEQQAAVVLQEHGPNVVPQNGHRHKLIVEFLSNFTHTMAIMLWVAGAVAFVGKLNQIGWAIWAVNIINGCFSFCQEYKADKAAEALRNLMPRTAVIIREGKVRRINACDVVPGDIVSVTAGDQVPADARIVEASSLVIDESIVSGESVPVRKSSNHENQNIIYGGTTILAGSGKAVVIATGRQATFGRMAALTSSAKRLPSPLEMEMARVSKRVSVLSVSVGLFIFVAAILIAHAEMFQAFIFSLGMIVAFVPEGMVPTVALALALGVEEMAKQNALVKKLSAVESLGCTTVICTDKTGTLTQNSMTVKEIWLPADIDMSAFMEVCCLCNDAEVSASSTGKLNIIGDSTEAALLIYAQLQGTEYGASRRRFPRIDVLPFDCDRKRMTTLNLYGAGYLACVKGAPNEILRRCDHLTAAEKLEVECKSDQFASDGLRVLALARRQFSQRPEQFTIGAIEQQLTFVGLVAMFDPPRPEVRHAVDQCHSAGIRVVMLTGDHGRTAEAVARHVDIVQSRQCKLITGADVEGLSDEQLAAAVKDDVLFCRVSPEHKLRIVSAFQRNGEIVAVTGDGVNDAAALRQANVGIAMGIRGTDVARAAADIILLDDNFATIVKAIKLGRRVYDNIRKFSKYVFTSNMAEAVPVAVFVFSRGLVPLPLTIMQVLCVDLGTDMLPAIGLGMEPADDDIMNRKPRSLSEPLLSRNILVEALLWYGALESALGMACYFFSIWSQSTSAFQFPPAGTAGYAHATTMTLVGIVSGQIAAVVCCRSDKSMLLHDALNNRLICVGIIMEILLLLLLMYIPILQQTFGTAPITATEAIFAALGVPVLIGCDEIRKGLRRRIPTSNDGSFSST